MCLLVVAWKAHPRYQLIVAMNRDEYHERPTAPLGPWTSSPEILAGRDLRAGGTWLGVDRSRRFGVLTNFRELRTTQSSAPSRGELIPNYLGGQAGAATYLKELAPEASAYAGFNMLLADEETLWYASNRAPSFARRLEPGVYGLCNQWLDTPWPKLLRVRQRLEDWLLTPETSTAALFAMLADREPIPNGEPAPHTPVPPELERALSAPFVVYQSYGTRCSTVLLLEPGGALQLEERRFDERGAVNGATVFELAATDWP